MGRRGPLPLPSAEKALRGTTRRDRAASGASSPSPLLDDAPPITLEREGLQMWRDLLRELRTAGLISTVDRATLAAYCCAWQRIAEARRGIKRTGGAVVKDAAGMLRMNPWVRIEKAATETLTRLATEFGLTPASRPRLGRPAGDGATPVGGDQNGGDAGPTLEGMRATKPN